MRISTRTKYIRYFIITVLILYVSSNWKLWPGDIRIIKNPEYTHYELEPVKLKLVHEIEDEIDEEHFFAQPVYLVPWKDGGLFVFDVGLIRIIKLDRDLKFQHMFLKAGQGPAEALSYPNHAPSMSISHDGILYLSCPGNKKIIGFSPEGTLKTEIRNPPYFFKTYYRPVVDRYGNIYVHSAKGGAVDVWDSRGKYLKTLLTSESYKTFVVMEPNRKFLDNYTKNGPLNTFYDVLPDNGFIIYITFSSTIYLFKNQKLVKSFNIWPEKLFANYARVLKKYHRSNAERDSYIPFTVSFFVDKDDERFFYIESVAARQLYKFDLNGKLVEILSPEKERGTFLAKKNNRYYGIQKNSGRVFIYEEDK